MLVSIPNQMHRVQTFAEDARYRTQETLRLTPTAAAPYVMFRAKDGGLGFSVETLAGFVVGEQVRGREI